MLFDGRSSICPLLRRILSVPLVRSCVVRTYDATEHIQILTHGAAPEHEVMHQCTDTYWLHNYDELFFSYYIICWTVSLFLRYV